MIQPNELRLGNIVLFDNKQDEIFMIGNKMVSGNKHSHFYYERLHPIPLTPEVLTDWCGFEKDKFYYFKAAAKGLVFYLDFDDKVLMIADTKSLGGAISIPIPEHLHTLQNLIYFLSGEEMPVNIPNH
jgi:hypothetical protein